MGRLFGSLRGILVAASLAVVAASLAVVAILVVVGVASLLLLGSLTIPRFTTTGPVVRNGVAVIVACGKKRGFLEATDYAPEARTGTWGVQRKGECNVYYHNPPDWHQREQRHLRAS
jgi:hypothetical protein